MPGRRSFRPEVTIGERRVLPQRSRRQPRYLKLIERYSCESSRPEALRPRLAAGLPKLERELIERRRRMQSVCTQRRF